MRNRKNAVNDTMAPKFGQEFDCGFYDYRSDCTYKGGAYILKQDKRYRFGVCEMAVGVMRSARKPGGEGITFYETKLRCRSCHYKL